MRPPAIFWQSGGQERQSAEFNNRIYEEFVAGDTLQNF